MQRATAPAKIKKSKISSKMLGFAFLDLVSLDFEALPCLGRFDTFPSTAAAESCPGETPGGGDSVGGVGGVVDGLASPGRPGGGATVAGGGAVGMLERAAGTGAAT